MRLKSVSSNTFCWPVLAGILLTSVLNNTHCDTVVADDPTAADQLPVPEAVADSIEMMKPYSEPLEHTDFAVDMVPVPGGTFMMGSPDDEPHRSDDEGPQRQVTVSPFWIGKYEVTWDQYDTWGEGIDQLRRQMLGLSASPRDQKVDGISKPTEPYTDMSFGMGKGDYPAISMTQHAARMFCKWLSAKSGRYYRLPTEAEWEFAARAGSTAAYAFGADVDQLDQYAWFFDNSDDQYQMVGQKKPNAYGIYDMHGNVSEWVLDQYSPDFYSKPNRDTDPLNLPETLYPRVVRGGGWDDDPDRLRSAVRIASDEDWKQQDPQLPRSIWYHTDALSVGFRVVRPLQEPSKSERAEYWDKTSPEQLDPPE